MPRKSVASLAENKFRFSELFYYTREECVFGWLYVFVCFSIIFTVNIVGMKSDVLLLQR